MHHNNKENSEKTVLVHLLVQLIQCVLKLCSHFLSVYSVDGK
jgi:hypothetical protein